MSGCRRLEEMYTAGLWHPSYGISTSWVMGVKKGKCFLSRCQMGSWVLDRSCERVSEWASEWVNSPFWQPLRRQWNGTGDSRDDWPTSSELSSRTGNESHFTIQHEHVCHRPTVGQARENLWRTSSLFTSWCLPEKGWRGGVGWGLYICAWRSGIVALFRVLVDVWHACRWQSEFIFFFSWGDLKEVVRKLQSEVTEQCMLHSNMSASLFCFFPVNL